MLAFFLRPIPELNLAKFWNRGHHIVVSCPLVVSAESNLGPELAEKSETFLLSDCEYPGLCASHIFSY